MDLIVNAMCINLPYVHEQKKSKESDDVWVFKRGMTSGWIHIRRAVCRRRRSIASIGCRAQAWLGIRHGWAHGRVRWIGHGPVRQMTVLRMQFHSFRRHGHGMVIARYRRVYYIALLVVNSCGEKYARHILGLCMVYGVDAAPG